MKKRILASLLSLCLLAALLPSAALAGGSSGTQAPTMLPYDGTTKENCWWQFVPEDGGYAWNTSRTLIEKIRIVDTYTPPANGETDADGYAVEAEWGAAQGETEAEKEQVKCYVLLEESSGTKRTLVIAGNGSGSIKLPADASNFFSGNNNTNSLNFNSVTEISGLDLLDTSGVTNMSRMFRYMENAQRIDVSKWNTSQVVNMKEMFDQCKNTQEILLGNIDTSRVTNMSYMFSMCIMISDLDLSGLDTSSVTTMERMFSCPITGGNKLKTLDVSGFDTSNVTDFSFMFNYCDELQTIDVSGFDTSKATTMEQMFYSCLAVQTLDVSGWDVSKVASMKKMFSYIKEVEILDLSGWNTENVTSMENMFKYNATSYGTDHKLKTIYVSDAFKVPEETGTEMFKDCLALVGQNGTVYAEDRIDGTYARLDKEGMPGYFSRKKIPDLSIVPSSAVLLGGGTVTLTLSGVPNEGTVALTCDKEIGVTKNEDGTYSASLPNETQSYTFTATFTSPGGNYEDATVGCIVSVTRYYPSPSLPADTTNNTTNTTNTANTTNTTTEKKPDGSTVTTVTDRKTGAVTVTTETPDGGKLVVETTKDGAVTTTETAENGVAVKTVEKPGQDVTVSVTIPKDVAAATVTIPAKADYGMVVVDARTGQVVKRSVPTGEGLAVRLEGSADLILVDRSKDFADTDGHWAQDGIDFAAAHELFSGTSETTFAPDETMTRAMLMTVLARFDGADTAGGVWYERGMTWAREKGISDGSAPEAAVTREQLAAMLYRYAGSPAVEGGLDAFPDGGAVSGYARQAMAWAVEIGLIAGTDGGALAPQSGATRAQVAVILLRFTEHLVR